ncbi:hypothetical protein HII28_02235 [Planctomonas sp. JC2975]|uniref:hypothetical protein n=1 Tax=Planctomonas sp. JC2975 TaxID=2729626 RepID=UPI00147416F3|nr:hypothetical protein [Planctomonas sp. JC2975]NNC10706.1 hypothetical protein [Planctomonas sp. JC2975]
MDWNWLSNQIGGVTLAQIIVWVIVAVLVIIGIRRAWPALKAIVFFADTWAKLPKFMADTSTMMDRLRTQVENDHKTNLREELTEALETVRELQTSMEGMHGRMDSLEASNDRQEQTLTDVQDKLVRDHKRLGVLEDTLPKEAVRELTERAEDEPGE